MTGTPVREVPSMAVFWETVTVPPVGVPAAALTIGATLGASNLARTELTEADWPGAALMAARAMMLA